MKQILNVPRDIFEQVHECKTRVYSVRVLFFMKGSLKKAKKLYLPIS